MPRTFFLTLFVSCVFGAVGQRLSPPALNPTDYKSPSGRFVLNVDPTDRMGRGEGNYQVSSNGVVVWTGTKPFTLYEAGITDDGIIGGYAYSYGVEGFAKEGRSKSYGEFQVVILKPNGKVVMEERVERTGSRFLHEWPNPRAGGMLMDGPKDRLEVFVFDEDVNRRGNTYWAYGLSTGKLIGKESLGADMLKRYTRKPAPESVEADHLKFSTFPDKPLKLLGTFKLQDGGKKEKTAVHDIVAFDMDSEGRIGFIRRDGPAKSSFVHLSADGRVLREVSLSIPAELYTNDSPKTLWLEKDRWVVVLSNRGVGGKSSGWWLNALTGEFKSIAGFKCLPIRELARMPSGGFVSLITEHLRYTMEDRIIAFDNAGNQRWEIVESHSDGDGELFSPEDLTVTSGGKIAVLDNIRETVQFFDEKGGFLSAIKLEKAWERKPSYPTDIAGDITDGVWIRDFRASKPLVHMDAAAKVGAQFDPKHPNGRIIDVTHGMRISPSGRLWVCDGECFIRLNDDGVADLVLGGSPDPENLDKIAGTTVDQGGRLYAVDQRTGAVHVFDESGSHKGIWEPDAKDFESELYTANVAVTSGGTVYVASGIGSLGAASYVQFGPDGKRTGTKRLDIDSVAEKWFGLPKDERMLVLGYHDAYLVDRSGKVDRTIQRRPNRKWLEQINGGAVAPDGTFAIIAGGNYWQKTIWYVNLYSADGAPLRTIDMPGEFINSSFAFSGKYLITRTDAEICVLTATGEPVLKFAPTEKFKDGGNELWHCFVTKGGRELWFVSTAQKAVWRYELPS